MVEGSGRSLFEGNIPEFAWRDCAPADIRTAHLPTTDHKRSHQFAQYDAWWMWIGKDFEGRGRGLTEVLSQHLRDSKPIESLSQDCRCPGPKFKPSTLRTEVLNVTVMSSCPGYCRETRVKLLHVGSSEVTLL
jgi:hypothetical protein